MIGAFSLIVIYHFYRPEIHYRDLALAFLVGATLFKLQLYMFKLEIIEKRVINLLQPGQRQGKMAGGASNLTFMIYIIFFWITTVSVALGFLPASLQVHF